MSSDFKKNITELNDSVKNYFQIKVELIKLSLLEKTSRIAAYLICFQIIMLFVFLIIAFLAVVFAVWYEQKYDNLVVGLLISSGFLVVLGLLFVLFRKQIVNTLLIRNFSDIMFEDDKEQN